MTPASHGPLAVGIDIGTTSVKAVAADADGNVVARARVPHKIVIPEADKFEHDADEAWRRGPREALAALDADDIGAISVTGMVPSLCAVDTDGVPRTPGLIYGEAVQVVLGVLMFISPWVMSYTEFKGISWSSWIIGVLTVVAGAVAFPAAQSASRTAGQH